MATLTAKRPRKKYNCNVAELYAGLNIIWKSQSAHEAEFAAENTLYTAGLWLTRAAAIKAASVLPNGEARAATAEVLRINLLKKHEQVMSKWNSLSGFIRTAFAAEFYKTRIDEAGKRHSRKALKQNWKEVEALLQSGKKFISQHGSALSTDGGMPAGFELAFNTLETEFKQLYEAFTTARQNAQEQTDVKIVANNAIWKDGQSMMKDARNIFRKQASLRERFTWKKVKELMGDYGRKQAEAAPV
jgi:hypothetical protein